MEIIIPWLILALVVAYLGSDRQIGGGWAFLWALILSPAVGFIILAFSPSLLSIERDRIQKKQLGELEAIRSILTKPDQFPVDEQVAEHFTERQTSSEEPTADVPKLTTWQRIKYGL